MVSDNAIFIHIPRCGGTSVETFFGNMIGHHQPAQWYLHSVDPHTRLFWFTIVRDPRRRAESLWYYWNNVSKAKWFGDLDQKTEIKQRQENLFRSNIATFDEMLAKVPWLRTQGWTDRHFETQKSFFDPYPFIAKYPLEDLPWKAICQGCNVPFRPLPRVNESMRHGEPIAWTRDRLEALRYYFAEDFSFMRN